METEADPSSAFHVDEKEHVVYLFRPKLGGFANDLLIQTEDRVVRFHVISKPFAPLGRSYTVCDHAMQEYLVSQQDHTALFPCHTIYEKDRPVARVGQAGVIPQNFFVEIGREPRLTLRIPVFGGIFCLQGQHGVVAEIAQHISTWIVVTGTTPATPLLLASIAIIYRESTIGG